MENMQTVSNSSAKVVKKRFSVVPTREKADKIIDCLKENKAQGPVLIDIAKMSSFTDMVIVVSSTSVRHGKALADKVLSFAREERFEFLRMEGYDSAQWILLDMNDILVNIFLQENRELYKLESLWIEGEKLLDEREIEEVQE